MSENAEIAGAFLCPCPFHIFHFESSGATLSQQETYEKLRHEVESLKATFDQKKAEFDKKYGLQAAFIEVRLWFHPPHIPNSIFRKRKIRHPLFHDWTRQSKRLRWSRTRLPRNSQMGMCPGQTSSNLSERPGNCTTFETQKRKCCLSSIEMHCLTVHFFIKATTTIKILTQWVLNCWVCCVRLLSVRVRVREERFKLWIEWAFPGEKSVFASFKWDGKPESEQVHKEGSTQPPASTRFKY